jgi:hypothetical protein
MTLQNKREIDSFLEYCEQCFNEKAILTATMNESTKEVFNQFMGWSDYIVFMIAMSFEDQLNFLLFCAAENNEL